MQKIEIRAYAKINLLLEILDKLPNGYHKIHSIFQAINLYDKILISKTDKDFSLNTTVDCPAKENLITKARERLEDFIGKSIKCRVHLFKNIPESAGLGGGSSDAASALICFNKLYKLNLSLHQLCKIGMQVGSDVPFFLYNIGTALVEGTGERIRKAKRNICNFYVLAKPCESINTRMMYSLFDKKGKNFFELTQEICPSVKKLYSYFSSISKEVGMTGTGPTIFAGFDSHEEALKAKNNFRDRRFKGDFYICRPSKKTYEIIF